MGYSDRKWKSGAADRGHLNWRQVLRNRPDHLVNIDNRGVYYERKRLKSKYYGVKWCQRRNEDGEWKEGRWHVSLTLNGEYHYGGEFREENEIYAAAAYDDLVRKLGVNRPLNFPSE